MGSVSRLTVVCCAIFFSVVSVSTRAAESNSVSVPELHQRVGVLLGEIDQIRRVLGIYPPPERVFMIRDAETRQVFYQAQTLFRKSNTLAQEIAGISPPAEKAFFP